MSCIILGYGGCPALTSKINPDIEFSQLLIQDKLESNFSSYRQVFRIVPKIASVFLFVPDHFNFLYSHFQLPLAPKKDLIDKRFFSNKMCIYPLSCTYMSPWLALYHLWGLCHFSFCAGKYSALFFYEG